MNEIEKEYSASYALVKLIEMAALGSGLVGGFGCPTASGLR